MVLYHGSKDVVEFPEIRKALYHKDFYFGFYCTKLPEQAKRWATRYGTSGVLNCYEYTPDNKLKYLVFDEMTEEWLDFIVHCRSGKSHTYIHCGRTYGQMTLIYKLYPELYRWKNFKSSFLGTGKIQSSDTPDQFSYDLCIRYAKVCGK